MNSILLTTNKLDINSLYQSIASEKTGAVSMFVGTTRDSFEGKRVIRLEYEAFEKMAEQELQKICESIRKKWLVGNIGIHHRLGVVDLGEASVIIAVSSVHRTESLEAVQYAIDTLKKMVPIWKKEVYEDERYAWKANKECAWSNQEKAIFSTEKNDDYCKRKIPESTSEFVQIKVGKFELEKRMQAFMERKRTESDVSNVQEFCHRLPFNESLESSCARCDSTLIRKKDSKSHLKVSRVVNQYGPQTKSNMPAVSTINVPESLDSMPSIKERILNMEKHVGLVNNHLPIPQNVYTKLKLLEDRILFLESISPEYFSSDLKVEDEEVTEMNKIDKRIEELRSKLKSS